MNLTIIHGMKVVNKEVQCRLYEHRYLQLK